MKINKFRFILASSVLVLTTQGAFAQSAARPADNTQNNKVDPTNRTETADAQKDNPSDRALTQRIRKSVMADKSLSTYAHNVKIVAVNGTVTLNGVVRTDGEKSSVARKAAAVAGQGNVVNDLKVAPTKD